MSSCSYCDHVMGGVCPAHQRRFANAVAAEIQPPTDVLYGVGIMDDPDLSVAQVELNDEVNEEIDGVVTPRVPRRRK